MGIETFRSDRLSSRAGYEISVVSDVANLGPDQRRLVLSLYDVVANEIWIKSPNWFEENGSGFFPADAKIFVVKDGEDPVGFSVARRFDVATGSVLFRWFTNIRPRYQNKGVLRDITSALLKGEMETSDTLPYYAFRTRNPLRWLIATRIAKRIVPDFVNSSYHPDLMHTAQLVAGKVYPACNYDAETLAVADAYPPGDGYQAPKHLNDETLDARVYTHPGISNPSGALIVVAELDRQKVSAEAQSASL